MRQELIVKVRVPPLFAALRLFFAHIHITLLGNFSQHKLHTV